MATLRWLAFCVTVLVMPLSANSVQAAPCSDLQQSVPLSVPASTGCISALGQCETTLTITVPANCSGAELEQAPYPTVLLFAGYQVPTRYYQSLVLSLAQNGFAVIQYERAAVLPAAEVESAYFEPLMQWRSAANSTSDGPYYGMFAQQLALAGHSMGGGLAAVAAGSHPAAVTTAFLMDPVDWNFESNRVDSQYLTSFNKPVAITSVGVHCLDKNSCYSPTNCSLAISTSANSAGCTPNWWCCDWDHGSASASGGLTQGTRPDPNGAQSFWATAPEGSWQINLPLAGHMSFLDYDPATDSEHLLSCPYTSPHTDVQPTVEMMLVAWMQHACRGLLLGQSWKSAEGGFLKSKAMTATN